MDRALEDWLSGQLDYAWQAIQSADGRMLATALFNLGTGFVVGGLTATVGWPVGLAAGIGAMVANTAVGNWAYGRPPLADVGANFAAEGLGSLGGMVGTALGGPLGGFLGNAIGAGLGQIASNALTGRPLDEGLLFSVGFSALTEGVGTAAGAWLGPKLQNSRLGRALGDLLADESGQVGLGRRAADADGPADRGLVPYDPEFARQQVRGFLRERGFSHDVVDKVLALPDEAFWQLGDLPPMRAMQIQAAVEEAGLPINVVGGMAKQEHHHPPSQIDVDIYIEKPLRDLWTLELREKLGPFDPRPMDDFFFYRFGWTKMLPGLRRPYIRFAPGQRPVWVKASWMK